jgi:DNA-binding protein HU-beta
MNRVELAEAVAEKAEVTKKEAVKVTTAVFDIITEALADGDSVQVTNFGTFETRDRAARTGRNPQNGDPVEIQATTVPYFHAGKGLKSAVA